jgi:SAM-dependent methyltransferase
MPLSVEDCVCPIDKCQLVRLSGVLECRQCGTAFPIERGVPVLINEQNSVFRIPDYTSHQAYAGASGYGGSADDTRGLRRAYRAFARKLAEAEIPGSHFDAEKYVLARNPHARILVIGSGEREYTGDVTYTDVAFSKGVNFICDAHDLPFAPESFDAVFADAVLEHVCDPQQCVSEIVRVLKPAGYVMATTPFLQPVHMGAHDFTRFTHLGHRRLFRRFDEIESGMSGGPMYSAIHVFRNLMLNVSDRPRVRSLIRLFALLVSYPLRHLDPLFSRTESSYNSACAFYFFGRKRATAIPDREIIGMFRGR